jgi:hypothetical protein
VLTDAPAVLRELLAKPGLLRAPGVFEGLGAHLVRRAGFSAAYLTGAGVAVSGYGLPDIGLVTGSEMVERVALVVQASGLPVIADADTGYGNAVNVVRTVHGYERAGVAAIQLEDQAFPKRCGHLTGKELISADEFTRKLHAAPRRARSRHRPHRPHRRPRPMIPICDDQESSGARVPRLRGGHAAAPCTGLALVAIIYPLIQGQTDGWPAWAFALLAAGRDPALRLCALRATPQPQRLDRAMLMSLPLLTAGTCAWFCLNRSLRRTGRAGGHPCWPPNHHPSATDPRAARPRREAPDHPVLRASNGLDQRDCSSTERRISCVMPSPGRHHL